MTAAWFRWERDFSCRYSPVVYHGEKPRNRDGATASVEVPADCLSEDGSPIFGKLMQRFPAPEGQS